MIYGIYLVTLYLLDDVFLISAFLLFSLLTSAYSHIQAKAVCDVIATIRIIFSFSLNLENRTKYVN